MKHIYYNGDVLTPKGTAQAVLAENGWIRAVGTKEDILPMQDPNTQLFDLQGCTLMPGFIDAHCHIGLSEDGTMYEGEDSNEAVNPVTPHVRAIDGINPADIAIREARLGGVTTVCVGPGNSNVYGGVMSVFKTRGDRIDDMLVKETYAIKAALGEGPKETYAPKKVMPMTRMGIAGLMATAQGFGYALPYSLLCIGMRANNPTMALDLVPFCLSALLYTGIFTVLSVARLRRRDIAAE